MVSAIIPLGLLPLEVEGFEDDDETLDFLGAEVISESLGGT